MRELVLRVPRLAVEEVLDRLLLIVPGGVRERPAGHHVELTMRGTLPADAEIEAAAGRWPHVLSERAVADDWRQRRVDDYEHDLIGGRLVVRPEWAPAAGDERLDVVLAETAAFGGGTHPTTRACLELLLELSPRGSFADLGCGSGVLAIVAARIGWDPVTAVDVQPTSVAAAERNAALNGVAVETRLVDLAAEQPPPAQGFAANFQPWLHDHVAGALSGQVPAVALLSGFGSGEADGVLAAYAARGLSQRKRVEAQGWCVVLVGRD